MKILGQDYLQEKRFVSAGSHRSCRPGETLAAYTPHMPHLGITRLANVTGLDRIGIPVYMAVRPNSRSIAVSQGKGIDADHAKVSALMESIENWHAEWIELPIRMGSYWEMQARDPTVDVSQLPLRDGARLRPDLPVPWIEGYDLLQEQPVWVPYEFVTMNTLLSHSMQLTYYNSSNGLASGNHLLEAILHGLLEVIERDALATWGRKTSKAQQQTRIALTTIDDPGCRQLLARFQQSEVELAVRDITSDIGFPAYECAIGESSGRFSWRRLGIFRGWGCHLSPAVALSRALCEAAQSRLTVISGSRDDNPIHVYAHQFDPEHVAVMHEVFFSDPETQTFGMREDLSTSSFEEDIEVVLNALREAKLERAIVVNLTRRDLGIPVVKVIVPGLGIGLHIAHHHDPDRRLRSRSPQAAP